MGFFGSLTGSTQRRDMKNGYRDSNAMLDKGYGAARGNINAGYDTAVGALDAGRGDLAGGYGAATNSLAQSTNKAAGYLEPFIGQGQKADGLYGDALGLNGVNAQTQFGQHYAASDPFRAQNAEFATNALMQSLNARGQSGGGYAAEAVARANLQRGSQDYNTYLDRLRGAGQQGMQAASGVADLYSSAGRTQAGMDYGYGSDLANIQGQKAGLATNRGNALAGLDTELAGAKAGNRINLANSMASTRGMGWNNLMSLGGMALKASGVGGYGLPKG